MSTDYTDTQLEMLTKRWKQDASPHLSLQLADVYRQRGDLERALPVLEKGLAAHPGHVSVQVALGRYRLEAGQHEDAAAVLREVVDKDAGHLVANKLLVRAYLALGDRKSAGDRLELYALLNDNDPELETLRAAVKGDLPVAAASLSLPAWTAGFENAPSAAGADLATVARPGGRRLMGALDREPFAAVRADPLTAVPLPGFFLPRVSEESPASAPGATEAPQPVLPRAEPESPVAAVEEAAAFQSAAEAESEAPAVEEVTQRRPPEPVDAGSAATATLGALYLTQGHFEDAKATFERVLERDPEDAEARAGLAEAESRLGAGREPEVSAEEVDRRATIAHLQGYLTRIREAADRLSA